MWLNCLLFLLSLLGAKADLNLAFNSGAFNYSLASAVHRSEEGASGGLVDLILILASGIPLNNNMEEDIEPNWNDIGQFASQVNCDQRIATCLTFLNDLTKSVAI